jgi:hypothetical protein
MTFDGEPQIGKLVRARRAVARRWAIERTANPNPGRVAAQLAPYRRGCRTQPLRDLPRAQARIAHIGETRPSRPPVVPTEGILLPAYVLISVGLVLLIALALMLQVHALAPPLDGRPAPSPAPQTAPVAPHG